MTSVESIEQAVQQLPTKELAEFRRWFAEFEESVRDRQIECDAAAGKLDALAAESDCDSKCSCTYAEIADQ